MNARSKKATNSIFVKGPLLILAIFIFSSFEGENLIQKIKQKLKKFNTELPSEKIYLQTDKSFYKPGEALWFRAFLVDGNTHKINAPSDVLYVEIINPKDKTQEKLTLRIQDGGANGSYTFLNNMPGGTYKLRAYTLWMKNFGEGNYFEKEIQLQNVVLPRLLMKANFDKKSYAPGDNVSLSLSARALNNESLANQTFGYEVSLTGKKIVNASAKTDAQGIAKIDFQLPLDIESPDGVVNLIFEYEGSTESIVKVIPIVLHKIKLHFFPEGGQLLSGYENNCAFEALDEYGNAARIEGFVTDSKGNIICNFSEYHMGMGSFRFTPTDSVYYASISKPESIKQKYRLPEARKDGFLFNLLEQTASNLKIKIASENSQKIVLTGQIRGEILYSQQTDLVKGENQVSIPTADFPAGILQLTLFDSLGIPRNERLFFVNPEKQLKVKLTTDKKKYQPREKVNLTIQTFDKDNIPVPARLCLSVVNDKIISFADDKQDNIYSYLMLSSELRGEIKEPTFYFDPTESKATPALNCLLLTHGWRRYNWNDILSENYQKRYSPEKLSTVGGMVYNLKDKLPLKAEVTLIEFTDKNRAARVTTNHNGNFIFYNVDLAAEKALLVKAVDEKPENTGVKLFKSEVYSVLESTGGINNIVENTSIETENLYNDKTATKKQKKRRNFKLNLNLDFNLYGSLSSGSRYSDIRSSEIKGMRLSYNSLDECLVISYQSTRESNYFIESQVHNLYSKDISIEKSLHAMASGLEVIEYSAGTGESVNLKVRGGSSLNSNTPLVIIDGVPINKLQSSVYSPLGTLNVNNISKIEIIKDGMACALYGADGANGAIIVTTRKQKDYYYKSISIQKKTKCNFIPFTSRDFSEIKEFYIPEYNNQISVEKRSDFRSTIYWNPLVKTDSNGFASVSFYNSDETTTFRATAEGTGDNGLAGRSESTYSIQMPFSIDTKIPPTLSFGDKVEIPVYLKNNTYDTISGKLSVKLPHSFELKDSLPAEISIPPQSVINQYLPCRIREIKETSLLTIAFNSKDLSDTIAKEIQTEANGFSQSKSFSGNTTEQKFNLFIDKPLNGSLQAEFKISTHPNCELVNGIESVLKEPHGCFEQASAACYPNILILKYLNATSNNKELMKKALNYINTGYGRLAQYETPKNGFDWFGYAPGNIELSAYAILEFTEMSKVYDKVDQAMIDRTVNWLMDTRDGKGNFIQQRASGQEFNTQNQKIKNAYILYALSECGLHNVETEYKAAYDEALTSKDPYRSCLMALCCYNRSEQAKGDLLLQMVHTQVGIFGLDSLKIESSITRSQGKSLQIETCSLYLLAMLKAGISNENQATKVYNHLLANKSYGGFGSTQATILALKAISEYTINQKQILSDGSVELFLNDRLFDTRTFTAGDKESIVISNLQKGLKPGQNTILVKYADTNTPLPYSIDASWYKLTPKSAPNCVVQLSTQIYTNEISVGELVRLHATISNSSTKETGMAIASIGIPAGTSLMMDQLKKMKERGEFDYFEIANNYLHIYYSQLEPYEVRTLLFDMKAEVPGTYIAPASSAYLYYNSESKQWQKGVSLVVTR